MILFFLKKKLNEEDEFWHELVLCGVGGQTIREAKNNLEYKEFLDWLEYRNTYGNLATHRKFEQSIGYLIYNVAVLAGNKKVKPFDFMPHETHKANTETQNSDNLTVEDMERMLK